MTPQPDLTEFLAARLDEDEATAQAVAAAGRYDEWDAAGAAGDDEAADISWRVVGITAMMPRPGAKAIALHIARHDPARERREAAAGRAILELHGRAHECSVYSRHGDVDPGAWCDDDKGDCSTLRLLAAVWSGHPDYREEWKP